MLVCEIADAVTRVSGVLTNRKTTTATLRKRVYAKGKEALKHAKTEAENKRDVKMMSGRRLASVRRAAVQEGRPRSRS